MANDSYTQQALAADADFRRRTRAQLSAVAWQVQAEDPATPNHDNRLAFARQVTRQLDAETTVILPGFVMRPNVFQKDTTYQFDFATQSGKCVSAATDADLASQLATDWDEMAAAAGFVAAAAPPARSAA